MKIALSFQNGKTISGHAGHCTQFIIYTTDNGTIISNKLIELEEDSTFHNVLHNLMLPFMDHPLFNVDVIISGSLGARFIEKMQLKGIEAIRTSETSAEEAVKKYINGELAAIEPIRH